MIASSWADALLTRPYRIASLLALTMSLLLITLSMLMDPDLIDAPAMPRARPLLGDGDQYLLVALDDDPIGGVVTFHKTPREAAGIALWNVSVAGDVAYEGVALLRHDRIGWRFVLELWLSPRRFDLIRDRLDDEYVCLDSSCFYAFRSDRHRLVPLQYAQLYRTWRKPQR